LPVGGAGCRRCLLSHRAAVVGRHCGGRHAASDAACKRIVSLC
jgi:hypothetical protein